MVVVASALCPLTEQVQTPLSRPDIFANVSVELLKAGRGTSVFRVLSAVSGGNQVNFAPVPDFTWQVRASVAPERTTEEGARVTKRQTRKK